MFTLVSWLSSALLLMIVVSVERLGNEHGDTGSVHLHLPGPTEVTSGKGEG